MAIDAETQKKIEELKDKLLKANDERIKQEKEREKACFIVNGAQELMTLINNKFQYEVVNKAYCRAYGKSASDIIGKNIWEMWGQERGDDIQTYLVRCFEGEVVKYENWYNFPAIGDRYFEITYYPYPDHGEVTHAVIVTHDITDRKISKDKLQDTCDMFERFLIHSPVAVYLKDENLRMVRVSKMYADQAETTMDVIIGKSNIEVWGEEFGSRLDLMDKEVLVTGKTKIYNEVLRGQSFISVKFPISTKAGKNRLGGFTIGPIPGVGGDEDGD